VIAALSLAVSFAALLLTVIEADARRERAARIRANQRTNQGEPK
jgi:hypothetical protein